MAKPIKETPILTGRDASNFFQLKKEAEDKKNSAAEIDKVKANAEHLKKIFK